MIDYTFISESDKIILNELQFHFPIDKNPYKSISEKTGIPEDEILNRINYLRKSGIIRRIGAVFNSASIGFVSILVALKIPENKIDTVAERLNKLSHVSHNYKRKHEYNLWFTLTMPCKEELEKQIEEIINYPEVEKHLLLPSIKRFKVGVVFNL